MYCIYGCFTKTDYQAMAENMLKMGMTHNKIDVQVLAQDLERLFNGVLILIHSRFWLLIQPI